MYSDKKLLKEKITGYLQRIDSEKSPLGSVIVNALKKDFNFDNVIKLCVDQYNHNKEGMISVVGEVPMLLILKYNQ